MKYLKSYLKNDTKTIKAIEDLMKSDNEETAHRIIMILKDDSAVNLEKIQTVLLCQKRDFNLTSGVVAILIAVIAILAPSFDTKLSHLSQILLFIGFSFFLLKLVTFLDRFQHSDYNKKIDYLVWLIEKNK
ncbi:hypothetical protein M3205_11955 [Cytobacillus firmus]|nr:hypothetical protein [Cytobacillus firmus]